MLTMDMVFTEFDLEFIFWMMVIIPSFLFVAFVIAFFWFGRADHDQLPDKLDKDSVCSYDDI